MKYNENKSEAFNELYFSYDVTPLLICKGLGGDYKGIHIVETRRMLSLFLSSKANVIRKTVTLNNQITSIVSYEIGQWFRLLTECSPIAYEFCALDLDIIYKDDAMDKIIELASDMLCIKSYRKYIDSVGIAWEHIDKYKLLVAQALCLFNTGDLLVTETELKNELDKIKKMKAGLPEYMREIEKAAKENKADLPKNMPSEASEELDNIIVNHRIKLT